MVNIVLDREMAPVLQAAKRQLDRSKEYDHARRVNRAIAADGRLIIEGRDFFELMDPER